jgi:hypothetical protein
MNMKKKGAPSVIGEIGLRTGSGSGVGEKMAGKIEAKMPVGAAGVVLGRCLMAHFLISFSFSSTVWISAGLSMCTRNATTIHHGTERK